MLNVIPSFMCASNIPFFRAFDCKVLALSVVKTPILCYPKRKTQVR
jgi:hypothetical protein